MHHERKQMAIDLEQFHQVFFEESLEGLDCMEQTLLSINSSSADSEAIDTIFRAAHSIKGGSGTFGFNAITEFTHVAETLLDEVRDKKRELTSEIIELLLQSCDCLRNMISALQAGQSIDDTDSKPLVKNFEQLLSITSEVAKPAPETLTPTTQAGSTDQNDILANSIDSMLKEGAEVNIIEESTTTAANQSDHWQIEFIPEPQILLTGNEPSRIFRELTTLGILTAQADTSALPSFDELTPDECFIKWTLKLESDTSKDGILEAFDWVLDECKLTITNTSDDSLIENTTTPPNQPLVAPAQAATTITETVNNTSAKATERKTSTPLANSSIRVGIDKVDNLINLVGELVITQSMLSELGNNFAMEKLDLLSHGLEQLLQNTKELQESVMRIRMLPIGFAFNRFPRMIRDLATKTGKQVELKLSGEQTELDKNVMEQISDPLVHLVRNAIDHGIEPAEERLAQGKEPQGNIHLNAYHKGGSIVIEISDDGRGIDPDKILSKAIEKSVVDANEQLSKEDIYNLIFTAGFSMADTVSDISGRGVGMDVVRRNIQDLGGRIEVESAIGIGSMFRVHLPLTLAILDGQLVRVGTETYIIPLISIVESLQIKIERVNEVSGGMVLYRLRDDNVPVIPIYKEFSLDTENTELADALLVVVEDGGNKIGLLVDDLLAQQQVVIKSLESNYKRVEGISGATILGDGSVSMILDIPGLIQSASRRAQSKHSRAA